MYYGIIGVAFIAFSAATEFIPELNDGLKMVKFTNDFKINMVSCMVLDYGLCYLIEKVLKAAFSDYKPKDIAERRPDQLAREAKRLEEERAKETAERERALEEKVAAAEKAAFEKRMKA